MNTLTLAKMNELNLCYEIINMGRTFQREQGFIQWGDNFPNKETIRNDIQNKKGYVLKVDDTIAGYMCIDFEGDPAYEKIQGQWHSNEPYAVIHRLSFHSAFRGMGLADKAFSLIEELCASHGIGSIRIDTGLANQRMQHILKKNGFTYCGIVVLLQGGERLAYEKLLLM